MPEEVLEKSVSPILTVYSQKQKPEKEETLSQITQLVAALELESEALKTVRAPRQMQRRRPYY